MKEKTRFREAFFERFDQAETRIVDLCKQTGVSRAEINKLISRTNRTVEVEDAIAIANFYGETVETFIAGDKVSLGSATTVESGPAVPTMMRLGAHDQERVRAYSEALTLRSAMSELDADDRNRVLEYIDALKKGS